MYWSLNTMLLKDEMAVPFSMEMRGVLLNRTSPLDLLVTANPNGSVE
jgi:hypothetical protein